MSVSLFMLFLLRERKYLDSLGLIVIQFFDCLAIPESLQAFAKASTLHSSTKACRVANGTGMPGSGPSRGVFDAVLAKSSAISLPSIPLCPGTHVNVTGHLLANESRMSLHSRARAEENL